MNINRYVDFVLVRHGETKWNEKALIELNTGETVQGPVIQGSSDIPLNSNGVAQAEKAAKNLATSEWKFASLYSSPLARAKVTAEKINTVLQLELQVEPRLAACSWGECEGQTKEYRRDMYAFDLNGNLRQENWKTLATTDRWKKQPIPGAESAQSLFQRMSTSFKEIASKHKPGDTILCATHQENIKTFSLFCQADAIESLRQQGEFAQIEELENRSFTNCGFYQFRYDLDSNIFSYHGEIKV